MMKSLFGILFLLCCSTAARAIKPTDLRAFSNGEKLVYAVSYKVSFVNTDVAEVSFNTQKASNSGNTIYRVVAHGKTYPMYRWFFDLNDTYTSILDSATLRPIDLRSEVSEAKYRYSTHLDYDWGAGVVNTTYRNHQNPVPNHKQLPLTSGSYDALALFFNLRCSDVAALERSGGRGTMRLVLEDTVRTISYRLLGREVRRIKGAGKFSTLKFRCQMATSTGESFKDGNEFTIWISDDDNRIPLYIESPIRVGSIQARIINWGGLAHPLASRVN